MKRRIYITKNKIDRSVKLLTMKPYMKNFKLRAPKASISKPEELKSALVKKFTEEYAGVARRLIFQAVNEAYAMVSLTAEPLLLLPALAEEKVQSAAAWSARQRSVPWLRPLFRMT
jgi:hypothetical protein